MTNEELLQKNSTYKKKFILLVLTTLLLLIIGNVPSILGEYYISNTFFRMSFMIFFIYSYRVFSKWKVVKKELSKRNLK